MVIGKNISVQFKCPHCNMWNFEGTFYGEDIRFTKDKDMPALLTHIYVDMDCEECDMPVTVTLYSENE